MSTPQRPIREQFSGAAGPVRAAVRNAWWRFRKYHALALPREYTWRECFRQWVENWLNPSDLFRGLLFAALCGVFVAQASVYWIAVIDDSYITFRFVDMFVNGHGWRFSPEGPRVEGFTNFLWAVLLIPPHYFGADLMYVSKIYGLICGMATMGGAWGLARAIRGRDDILNLIPPALMATNAHFAVWAMMGLETLLQVALVVWAFYRFEQERRDARRWLISPFLCVLAAMTRIDSLWYLSPLGLYGVWCIVTCRMPFKRMLLWAVLAAVPFLIYWTWRWNYFGDLLPNTYYAKQRHVVNEGHERGALQLFIYYFNQGDIPNRSASFWSNAEDGAPVSLRDRFLAIGSGNLNSWAWMNIWLAGAVLSLTAAGYRWIVPRGTREAAAFLREPQGGRILTLLILPWVMNVYYVHHVNGDWMPSFRFFQIALPFIGVAVAVGVGQLLLVVGLICASLLQRLAGALVAFCAIVFLLAANAVEQGRIDAVYIFSKDGIYWSQRPQGWQRPAAIRKSYSRGFVPPLQYVSEYLLLNTQDDAWIFMSDIGQPLWYSEHLNLYDVDGLTDPFLAHAPSTRGNLPTLEEHARRIKEEWRVTQPDAEQRAKILDEARRRDFEAFLDRNTRYIMEQRRPEYLLLFINHESNNPKSAGGAYPQISWRVYAHPNMKDYVEDTAISKIGNVYNHVFRRADVPREVPNRVKLDRLYRIVERNPRMPAAVAQLFREAQAMEDLSDEDQARVRGHVLRAIARWPEDPVVQQMAINSRDGGDRKLARALLDKALEENPNDYGTLWSLALVQERDGKLDEAVRTLEKAIPLAPPDDNQVYYQLMWVNEELDRLDKVREYARVVTERRPTDPRPWSDLASALDRAARKPQRTEKESLALKKEALAAFEQMAKLMPEKPPYLVEIINNLVREVYTPSAPTPSAPDLTASEGGEALPAPATTIESDYE